MSVWEASASGGQRLSGTYAGPPLLTRLVAAPPYPGASVVMPATVPDPPLLDPTHTERAHVLNLCFTWRTVLRARMGASWFVKPAIVTPRWRYYKQLANAAEQLIKHSLWPMAWGAWSIDLWKRDGSQDAPPLTVVWAAKRIERLRGWFGKEAQTYLGGRAIFGAKHRDLLRRWTAMGYELIRAGERPEDSARIVERWFPGALYDELVRSARVEAATKTAELRARVDSGEWVW